MPLQPSRRDVAGPPPRNVSDLSALVRHQASSLRGRDPGYLDGRFATPQPNPHGPSELVGGDGEGGPGDGTTYEWQWEDRHTVTALGTQSPVLTYEPVEESLFVRWHPAGRGGLPLTNELFLVNEQTVTIPDPDGLLALGDQFSFQYQFDPGLQEAPDEFDGLIFRGDSVHYSTTTSPGPMPLPPETQVGDTVVLGTVGFASNMVDPRFTLLNGDQDAGTWIAYDIPNLSDVLISSGDNYWACAIAAFAPVPAHTSLGASSGTTVAPDAIPLPVIAGQGAIVVILSGYSLSDTTSGLPAPDYVDAASSNAGKNHARIAYWTDPDGVNSPTATSAIDGSAGWSMCVIGFGG